MQDAISKTITALKREMHSRENELSSIRSAITVLSRKPVITGRRKLSAAAREKIAVAQRSRWAKWKASKGRKAA